MPNIGKIIQIIGPVVDVQFAQNLPAIYNALTLTRKDKGVLTFEVEQQLNSTDVRTIALGPTEG
ncbi:F0F1 ATP synthase subunit beta, partial [Candidatus Woesebacteria bacterium]|nr:F0F1 ATP synthase subunit beta [Candidatus Woesebacteria bacterium]